MPRKKARSCVGQRKKHYKKKSAAKKDAEKKDVGVVKEHSYCKGAAYGETLKVDMPIADIQPSHQNELQRPNLVESEVMSYQSDDSRDYCPSETPASSVSSTFCVDADNSASTKQGEKRKDSGHKCKFDDKWSQDKPWLKYMEEFDEDGMLKGLMFCSLCQKWYTKGRNGSAVWNKLGCETVRLDKVNAHESSQMHQDAIQLEKSELSVINETFAKLCQTEISALVDAQKVLYFLIKHHLSHTTLFKPLVELCIELGANNLPNLFRGKNATYTGHCVVQEFVECQSEVVADKVEEKMKQSSSYGLMLDEYTDVSTRKHLAFVGRYVENGESKLAFLQDVEIPNGTADTIVDNVRTYIHAAELDMKKMTCFASDGPAVMTGKKNGVVAQLKRENPSLIDVHCINHRMQLAISSSFRSVTDIECIDELLMGLFKYYHYSTVRTKSLEQMQLLANEMDTEKTTTGPLTIKKAVHTRWLSHEKAVHTVRQLYYAILTDLENAVGMGNDKRAGDKLSVTAEGLYKQLKSYDKLYFILLLCDVCSTLSALTKLFERRDLDLSLVEPQLQSSINIIKKMKQKPGPYLVKVDHLALKYDIEKMERSGRRLKIEDSRDLFLDRLVCSLEERLINTPVLTNLAALDLRKAGDASFLTFYGDAEVSELADHFGLDPDVTLTEWNGLKEMFGGEVTDSSPFHMLQTLTTLKPQTGELYPNLVKLLCIYSTVILSTSEVERVFSQVKLIVTEHRNRLKVSNCNRLLMISLNTGSHSDIDLEAVVKKFLARKQRRL